MGTRVVTVDETGTGSYVVEVSDGVHTLTVDEPVEKGGADTGPDPYGLLLGALGSCTAITIRMFADRRGWPLESVAVTVEHARLGEEERITCDVRLAGPLDEEQRERLLVIAGKCPIHKTLRNHPEIVTTLAD